MTFMKTQERKKVCVIGGGPSGLMCAIESAKNGAHVTLFEGNRSNKILECDKCFDNAYLGKKLLITGKGRCNVTNFCTNEEFLKNVPVNPKFLYTSLGYLSTQDLMDFFENAGTRLKVERGNRVFPASDKSVDILNALKENIKSLGVKVINRKIAKIITKDGKFSSVVDENGACYDFDACAICTGGLSYSVTGSTGDGYKFAKETGHRIVEQTPSLVPLEVKGDVCKNMQGLSLKNVQVTVIDNQKNKKVFSGFGEMLFTHFGLSGPLILSASSHMRNMSDGRYSVLIDLKPSLDEKTLDTRLLSDFHKYINKNLDNALCDILPSKLILPFIQMCNLSKMDKPNSVTKEQRRIMVQTLMCMKFDVSGFRPINEAIITSGGVSTKDINPSSMMSKIVKNLYFAGEVIDIDAYTGGFNLQIAFSTGALAGFNMARINDEKSEEN